MDDSEQKKQVTTAHRKVKKAGVQSRRSLKRPSGKVLEKSKKSKKTTKAAAKPTDEKKVNVNKKTAQTAAKAKKATKSEAKKTVKVATEISISRKIRVRAEQYKEPTVEKILPEPTASETKTTEPVTVERRAEPKTEPKAEIVKAAESKAPKVEIVKVVEPKAPKTEIAKLVEPKTPKAEPAKIAKPETIRVHRAEQEQTPEEHLEEQARFWSSLPVRSTVVKVPTPGPVNMDRVNERMRARTIVPVEPPKIPASELKQQAIQKALKSAERTPVEATPKKTTQKKRSMRTDRVRFTWGRIMLALSCTVVAVLAIVYFVNLSAPDVSLKVAAMQSGIEATYPSFTPRDYSLSDITSEDGKITLTFRNNDSSSSYTLTEERSSWDAEALVSNYIRPTYGDEYTAVREQGLTLYITNNGASWVNGGLLYKLKVNSGSLTKKQIKTIATSL